VALVVFISKKFVSEPARRAGERKVKKDEAGGAKPRLLKFIFLDFFSLIYG